MKDIIINVSRETRKVECLKGFIGNDGENLQGNIIFKFDDFVDGVARLEYIINDAKMYHILTKQDKTYNAPIKSVLTKEGQINAQIVITESEKPEGIPIFKSEVFTIYCGHSINAEIEQPEEYPQWIEIANAKIIEINEAIREVEEKKPVLRLDYHGGKIYNKELQVDYLTIRELIESHEHFVYLVWENVFMIPAFITSPTIEDPAIEFLSTYIISGEAKIPRIIINSSNEVKFDEIYVEDKDYKADDLDVEEEYESIAYTSVKAVKNAINGVNQEINNIDVEVGRLNDNINLIANDIDTHTEEINALESKTNKLESDLLEQEETINYISDTTYNKEEVDDKLKGLATTSSLIAGINGCQPKLSDTVDYVIETGVYGDGESGYRKYKNGFIEQWGVATTNANETEFRMHKPHINQNFSIFIEPREIGNFYHYAMPSSNQHFKCRIQSRESQSMAIKFQWRSFGKWK